MTADKEGYEVAWLTIGPFIETDIDTHFKSIRKLQKVLPSLSRGEHIRVDGKDFKVQYATITQGWRITPKSRRRTWNVKCRVKGFV